MDFIDCVAWRQTGEFVSKWFTKGAMIVVSGRLQMRKWTDKDGKNRTTAEILADNVYFGESKKDREANNAVTNNPYTVPNPYTTTTNTPSYGGYNYMTPVQPGSDWDMMDDDGAVLPF